MKWHRVRFTTTLSDHVHASYMNKDCVVYGDEAPRRRSNLIEIATQGASKVTIFLNILSVLLTLIQLQKKEKKLLINADFTD